jgi:adhesin/invasin
VTVTSSTTIGRARITATDDSVTPTISGAATLIQSGPPTTVRVTLNPPAIAADGTSTTIATATITDAEGNPVDGQQVTWRRSSGETFSVTTLGSAPGTYQVTVTSSTTIGRATITATDDSVTPTISGAATLNQTPPVY